MSSLLESLTKLAAEAGLTPKAYLALQDIHPVDVLESTEAMLNLTEPAISIRTYEFPAGSALRLLSIVLFKDEAEIYREELCEDSHWVCIGNDVYEAEEIAEIIK